MKVRVAPVAAVDDDGVPWDLAIGRCVEVWSDPTSDYAPEITAWSRYSRECWRYIASLGLPSRFHWSLLPERLRQGMGSVWSFDELEERDPARLAEHLRRARLPRDWRPS